MKLKILLPITTLLVVISGVILFGQQVHATGEAYSFSGTGSGTNGLGGSKILADDGAFKSETTFNLATVNTKSDAVTKGSSIAGASNSTDLVAGYSTYYVASSFNLNIGASEYPGCRTVPAIIALKSPTASTGILYPSATGNTSCNNIGHSLANLAPTDSSMALSDSVSIGINADAVTQAAYYSALSTALNPIKVLYYQSLGQNAPCSSQGCNDTAWAQLVGSCWATARTNAADTSRQTAQAIAEGANIAVYDEDTGTINDFASCLSTGIKGAVSPPVIINALTTAKLSVATVNGAGDNADNTAIASATPTTSVVKSTATCGSIVLTIGWILCPALNALGGLDDSMWNFVSTLLTVSPLEQGSASTPYVIWESFRSIANVLLVIVFLVIIFSQLTSFGIGNYGIKKMLPRLIAAAILINISYFVVQIAVDISNVIGNSLYALLNALTGSFTVPTWQGLIGVIAGGGVAVVAGATAVAFSGGAEAIFFLMLPAALVAVLGFLAALAVLILRQALIPILAILAPLAFVAYLLPNTQQWFNKWKGAFISMLMLYPIAAVLFGGVKLSAKIIGGGSNANWWQTLVALIILGAPLFLLPFVARQGGPILSKISGTLGGFANKARKPAASFSASQAEHAKARYESEPAGKGSLNFGKRISQRFDRTKKIRDLETSAYKTQAQTKFNNNLVENSDKYAANLPEGSVAQQSFIRVASATAEKMETEAIHDAAIRIRTLNPDQAGTRELALGKGEAANDSALQAAAIQRLVTANDVKGMESVWDASKTWESPDNDPKKAEKLRATFADSLQASNGRPAYYGQGAIAALRLNGHDTNTKTVESAISANAYSPSRIASGDKEELTMVAEIAATSTNLTTTEKQNLVDNAHTATTDPELARTIGKNRDQVENIRTNIAPTPAQKLK